MLSLLPFLLIILVFWFLIIRPQQKRQRDAQQMQSALGVDSKVMLSSGIFGTVSEITDDHVGVEIAEGVSIKVVRAAISRILPEETGEETEGDLEDSVEDVDATGAVEVPAATAATDESVEDTLAKYTPEPVQPAEKND